MATERGIEETLRNLELTGGDPAEVAALAAERVAASGGVRTVAPGANDEGDEEEEEDEEGDEGDDEEEEDEEGEETEVPAAAQPHTPPKPQRRGGKGGRYARDREDPGILPVPPALVPPPRTVRGQPKTKSPAVSKLGRGLADKVPGAERIKVYKRAESGDTWFIKDYTVQDLKGFPDFEMFLSKYIMPAHGPGEYDLVGVDGRNNEYPLGTVRLKGLEAKGEGGEFTELMKTVMTTQQERDENYLKRMEQLNRQPPQMNPLELLKGVMDMQERLSGGAAAGQGDAITAMMKAMAESGNQTMMMMMTMMQQQQAAADRSNQLMMTLLSKPKEEDPLMKILLAKFLDDGPSGGVVMAPPPPPSSKTEGLSDILQAMAAFMGAMGGGGGGGDDGKEQLIDFLKQMALKDNGGMSTKEVLQLVMQKNGEPGTDDFRKAVDNMATMMNIANTLRQQAEPGGGAGFFDALGALLGNRDFIGTIANTIRAKTDATDAQKRAQMEAERQRLELAQRMQAKAAMAAGQQTQQLPAQPPQQQAQPQPRPMPSPAVTAEAQQAAENYVRRTGKPLPELPANTYEHINMLVNAQDEGQLVARTIALFVYFAEYDAWRPFSERLLGLIRDGAKKDAMAHLTPFFEGLVHIQLIDATVARKVIAAIDKNFDAVMQNLTDFSTESEGGDEISGDDLVATAEKLAEAGA